MAFDQNCSPCAACKRVRDPDNCGNKSCADWQPWWISRWDAIRMALRGSAEKAALREEEVQSEVTE